MDLGIREGVFEKGWTLRASGPSLFQFLIGEHDAGWMRPAQRVHEQLQALGLDSRLDVRGPATPSKRSSAQRL